MSWRAQAYVHPAADVHRTKEKSERGTEIVLSKNTREGLGDKSVSGPSLFSCRFVCDVSTRKKGDYEQAQGVDRESNQDAT